MSVEVRDEALKILNRIQAVQGHRIDGDHMASILAQNTVDLTGICIEQQKTIVDLSRRLDQIERLMGIQR